MSECRLAFSITEFSKMAGLSRSTIYKVIKDGQLKARRLGSRTLITKADAEAFFDALPKLETGKKP